MKQTTFKHNCGDASDGSDLPAFAKRQTRSELKRRLSMMDESECRLASAAIFDRLISLPELNRANVVFCYVSLPKEVATLRLIEYLIRKQAKVCVPRCEKDGVMDARILTSLADLKPVPPFGILEPSIDAEWIDPSEIDFAVIPGLGFDRSGARLGKGAGYYDRYLSQTNAVRCGVCYDRMLLDQIPVEDHDIRMDLLVTDQTLLRFN